MVGPRAARGGGEPAAGAPGAPGDSPTKMAAEEESE